MIKPIDQVLSLLVSIDGEWVHFLLLFLYLVQDDPFDSDRKRKHLVQNHYYDVHFRWFHQSVLSVEQPLSNQYDSVKASDLLDNQ